MVCGLAKTLIDVCRLSGMQPFGFLRCSAHACVSPSLRVLVGPNGIEVGQKHLDCVRHGTGLCTNAKFGSIVQLITAVLNAIHSEILGLISIQFVHTEAAALEYSNLIMCPQPFTEPSSCSDAICVSMLLPCHGAETDLYNCFDMQPRHMDLKCQYPFCTGKDLLRCGRRHYHQVPDVRLKLMKSPEMVGCIDAAAWLFLKACI